MKHLERSLDGQNQFWKYIVMFLGAFLGGQILGSIPLAIIKFIEDFPSQDISDINNISSISHGLSLNLFFFLLLIVFVICFLIFALLLKPLHKRSLTETINGTNTIRKDRILMGIIVWGIAMIISTAITIFSLEPHEYEFHFDITSFIPLLIITILVLPFQTTFEELLFRGYLSQGIAGWTKSRWASLIIVSFCFGLVHIANPEVEKFGFFLSMPQYIFIGLLFGITAILDDGIEIAIGMHFINNAFNALFTTHSASALQTNAVFTLHSVNPVMDLILLLVLGTVSVFFLSKKYKWDWRILNKKVGC